MVSRELYNTYVSGLDTQYSEAGTLLARFIDSLDWNVGYDELRELRDQVLEVAYSLVETYGSNASFLAAEFYEAAALEAGVMVAEPLIGDLPRYKSVASSIRYAARVLWGGRPDPETFKEYCLASLKRFIKQCGDRTMEANAKRDGKKGVKWARVPRGPETCAFCIMVASRGFVYASEESASFFGHSHEHCDCDIVCGFDDQGLEGYDEKLYRDMYYDSVVYDGYGHVNADETRNNLRRYVYELYGDHNREVARKWYARNSDKERERQRRYRENHREEINAKKRGKRAAEKAASEKSRWMAAYREARKQQDELGI